MTKIFLILFCAFLLLVSSSCSTSSKILALKPEPDDASPLIYENQYSIINMPVSIKLKDIENKTNASLSGLIYEDTNIEDDDIEINIWKQAPISITNENGKIKTVLPLKVKVKYRYGINKMGVDLRDIKEFNLNGNVNLLSDFSLSNWSGKSKTTFQGIDWNESPTMTILGKNMPITYLINPAVKLFKSKIEKKIDESIEKSMDFKPNVLDALEKVCTPFQLNEQFQTWLRISPSELYSTDAKVVKDKISMQMGLKCNLQTLIGNAPENRFNRDKMILKPVSKMQDEVTANIVAVSSYVDASAIITKNFAGQEFGSGNKKVTVQKVAIWHKQGKMIIALDMLGSLNGTIYLAGFPQYNPEAKEIYFDELDYVLDTKNALMRTANWLAQGLILKKIQQSCRYSITPNINEAKQSLKKYLDNYTPMSGVFINGKVDDIDFQKIQLTNKAIIAFVKANGKINVNIDGLK